MAMTKKDYELMAKVFNNYIEDGRHDAQRGIEYSVLVDLAEDLATAFETYNPRFDRDRFLQACGIEQNDFTYDCRKPSHAGNARNLSDSRFPTRQEIKDGMNPEYCLDCQPAND